jgi:orotate phosphoribosyltransferase
MDRLDKKWFVNALRKCGALKYGDFILTSGKRSGYYVDIKAAVTRPDMLRIIGRGMAPHASGYARIAGVELGAVPIAVAVSLETDLPYIMVRKEKKEHGTQKPFEGEMVKGEKILFVEDVVTTGGTLMKAILDLRERGASIDKVVCVVDRQEGGQESLSGIGVSLYSLLTGKDLLAAA